jgi:hypothetical protein
MTYFTADVWIYICVFEIVCSKILQGFWLFLLTVNAKNGPVYAGITYQNFFLFLNLISALINMYYIHLSFFYFSDGISLLFRFY